MAANTLDSPNQQRRVALITGANAGLGFETAKVFVRNNIKVVLACRCPRKAEESRLRLLSEFPSCNINVLHVDLSKLASVHAAAEEFRSTFGSLDILVNNAGIMFPPYSTTEDGFEYQMATNCFGHFLLTLLLIDRMPDSQHSRIVWVSSMAHKSARINFDDLQSERTYSKTRAYSQSKLACLLYAFELDRKLRAAGKKTRSIGAHPGGAHTELGHNMSPWLLRLMRCTILPLITQSAADGALPIVEAALSPSAQGGEYYGPQGFMQMKGPPGIASVSRDAQNADLSEQLWQLSEQLTNTSYQL